jgi:probable HAF family extracellular repeat protein
MTDLGTLGTDLDSEASNINSESQITGWSFSPARGNAGFLWENGGPMVDLNTLVLPSTSMYVFTGQFINDRGEIACTGATAAVPNEHPCMLIPCDENHPGVEGCDYNLVDATTVAQDRAPRTTRSPAETNENHSRLTGWPELDGRLIHRRGFSGVRSPNN